jgi:hypothetical protein
MNHDHIALCLSLVPGDQLSPIILHTKHGGEGELCSGRSRAQVALSNSAKPLPFLLSHLSSEKKTSAVVSDHSCTDRLSSLFIYLCFEHASFWKDMATCVCAPIRHTPHSPNFSFHFFCSMDTRWHLLPLLCSVQFRRIKWPQPSANLHFKLKKAR